MKFSNLSVILGIILFQTCLAEASVLNGTDEEGKICTLEFVGALVKTSYSGNMLFELDSVQGVGTRSLVTASTKSEFVVAYSPSNKLFTYDEFRSNIRTGDIFFERHHDCNLK